MSKHNQPQLHRTVGGTKSGRRLLAVGSVIANAYQAGVDVGLIDELTTNGNYKKAQRKGVASPVPVIKDDSGKRVVVFNRETIKQIQSLQQGKRPHIGSKQQLRQVIQGLKKNPACGCTIKLIRPECEIHKILVKVEPDHIAELTHNVTQSDVVSDILPEEQTSDQSQG